MIKVFISYSHADDQYRAELQKHLALLQREGRVDVWHDHRIPAGGELETHISAELEAADVILLLVSADFLASDYCYSIELKRAMERHAARTAVVVPIILRPCDWHSAPFGRLKAQPTDGRPVVKWPSHDEAYSEIAKALRSLLNELEKAQPRALPRPVIGTSMAAATTAPPRPRSSSLALRREFHDIDRDRFLDEAFAYIRNYFENSLDDLGPRNPGYETQFRQVSESGFTGTIYRHGKKVAGCYIRMDSSFGRSRQIAYSNTDEVRENSLNEALNVDADDHSMFLKLLMGNWSGKQEKLTFEGAAEKLWQSLIEHLASSVG